MSDRRSHYGLAAYMLVVSVIGVPALAVSLITALGVHTPGPSRPLLCLALGLVLVAGEMMPIRVARGDDAGDEITISSTIALALAVVAPIGIAALAQAVALAADEARARRMWQRLPFNIAQYTLALLAARWVYDLTTGLSMSRWYAGLPARVLVGELAAAAAYFIVNNGLTGVAVALKLRVPVHRQVADDMRHQILTSGVLLALAPVTTIVVSSHPLALPLLLLPLAAVHRSARLAYAREHEALHDTLTGLANRALFNVRLERAHRDGRHSAVLLIDIDHFKEINDTLGHHAGDLLLVELAKRLRTVVRDGDLVARLGGDEFAVLLENVVDEADLTLMVERVREALHREVSISGVRIDTTASVGVVLAADEDSAETLLRRADVAMYEAKRSRGTVAYYEPDSDGHTVERLTLLGELRAAAENGQIYLAYQPKVSLRTGEIVGLEALARWKHPTYGELGPLRFIPLAENTGLIDLMTHRLLEQGLDQLITWQSQGLSLGLAINISARSLADETWADQVRELLEERGVEPHLLTLEVTESSIMMDVDRSVRVLNRLREIGVRIAIDDFGTGYSSLAYLKRIHADELKIDRTFVQKVAHDTQDEIIVGMTIQLGHEFNLDVVAEGVEDEAAYLTVQRLGCDAMQGYFIARPMPALEITEWLKLREAAAAVGAG